MKIINENNLKVLIADENKHLREKGDIYKSKYISEDGTEVEEHFPYYFTKAYVPPTMTIEEAMEQYIEEKISESELVEESHEIEGAE